MNHRLYPAGQGCCKPALGGRGATAARAPRAPADPVRAAFREAFGHTPSHVVRAPGWIGLLGDDARDNEGLLLAAPIDRFAWLATAPRTDGRVVLISTSTGATERVALWVNRPAPDPVPVWAEPMVSVLAELRRAGVHFTGFNAALHQDPSLARELGSLPALTTATVLAVRQLHPFRLGETGLTTPPRRDPRGRLPPPDAAERMALARCCHAALALQPTPSNATALVDWLPSLWGRAQHLLSIDCRDLTVDALGMFGVALVLCELPALQDGPASDPRYRRWLAQASLHALRTRSLRSADRAALKTHRARMNERAANYAAHIVDEIQRVAFAERAARQADYAQLGQYLLQSHASAREALKDHCPEAEVLVELAAAHPACLGARRAGDPGGRLVAMLADYHQVDPFLAFLRQGCARRTPWLPQPWVAQLVDGAGA